MSRTHPFRTSKWIIPAIFLCSAFTVVQAQSSDNQSSTATSDLNSNNANPTRFTDTHTQTGSRTVDTHSLQRLGPSGDYEPYQDIETESVKVSSTTTWTLTRTFGRDSDGRKTLLQVREEEQHTQPGGNSSITRTVSNPDADGRLQPVQREIEQTKKIGNNIEETQKTVMLPGINGGLVPAMQVHERRERDANDTVKSEKTTLLPDGSGNWQVNETRNAVTRKQGDDSTTDERISRLDPDGKLNEVSRTLTHESGKPGEKRDTSETYSVDVPGSARDGSLHLVERSTTLQRTGATGQKTTQHEVDQPNPGDPNAGLRVALRTTDTQRPGASGSRTTQTIEALDPNGDLFTVSVDTTKSDTTGSVQVQIAPTEKKK